jgi:peptide chain release factor 3
MRWLDPETPESTKGTLILPTGARRGADSKNQPVLLFTDPWSIDFFIQKNSDVKISKLPFDISQSL